MLLREIRYVCVVKAARCDRIAFLYMIGLVTHLCRLKRQLLRSFVLPGSISYLMTRFSLCRSLLAFRTFHRMAHSSSSYELAIQKLNQLQSNKSSIEQIRKDIKTGQKCTNLEDMENYLLRTGVSLSKLDELSVIHVAGTKGKGSTSAMCESILRAHGLRTGLFTSPHLVAVRERIRLQGHVVSTQEFAKHFHRVYDLLESSKAHDADMPKYFSFLTVLAFNMFLSSRVDVAVVEVGIGGVVDFTNVLRKVPVVGITALGIDHTSILGSTIEEIAAAKAGIMKRGCEAYTVHQPENAMKVLRKVARNVQCNLYQVPDYKAYTFPKDVKAQLQVDLDAYRTNASLAIQLAHAWIRMANLKTNLNRRNSFKATSGKVTNCYIEMDMPYITEEKKSEVLIKVVPRETLQGLCECNWPGRYQVIHASYATFYLDGAHTKESMEICADWFNKNNRSRRKILIFSATGDRDVQILLKPLRGTNFEIVFFVIPSAYKELTAKSDNYSIMEHKDLHTYCQMWKNLPGTSDTELIVSECVSDALVRLKSYGDVIENPSVLITGSLHLVGAALSILDPNLSKDVIS